MRVSDGVLGVGMTDDIPGVPRIVETVGVRHVLVDRHVSLVNVGVPAEVKIDFVLMARICQ